MQVDSSFRYGAVRISAHESVHLAVRNNAVSRFTSATRLETSGIDGVDSPLALAMTVSPNPDSFLPFDMEGDFEYGRSGVAFDGSLHELAPPPPSPLSPSSPVNGLAMSMRMFPRNVSWLDNTTARANLSFSSDDAHPALLWSNGQLGRLLWGAAVFAHIESGRASVLYTFHAVSYTHLTLPTKRIV